MIMDRLMKRMGRVGLGIAFLISTTPDLMGLPLPFPAPPVIETPSMTFSNEGSLAEFPDLPKPLTSFGAAILGDSLYVYGGHLGEAHTYSTKEQSDVLYRLDLGSAGGPWSEVATGPKLQGLALVSDGEALYRVGGFTARNAAGEEADLWSQDTVARFDPETREWTELPKLPEPRSSHDAVVHDGKIYVVGGWQLRGDQATLWHKTAWVLDLAAVDEGWQELPEPPFQRRALAMASCRGKIFVVGGMQQRGGPTPKVAVFDPAEGEWSSIAALQGDAMSGFGAAAFGVGETLYVSTVHGELQAWSGSGDWKVAQTLPSARFFHRMLPWDASLVIVGGANMDEGKYREVERIKLD